MTKRIDPETEALWAEQRRQLKARVDQLTARIAQDREDAVRRKERLRRLTFGVLGR